MYGGILDMIHVTDKKLLHFKLSKSGQILCVDKTCFPRPGHKCNYKPLSNHIRSASNLTCV